MFMSISITLIMNVLTWWTATVAAVLQKINIDTDWYTDAVVTMRGHAENGAELRNTGGVNIMTIARQWCLHISATVVVHVQKSKN